ncbi:ABC-2 type transport system permease protein [Sphingomonas laterariae]|uniref:ABC-2 type transport system permease protein n=1 Tax=Edaphosphingomonas laterariae TaxID=861865 RepID=A0A239HDZ2_9SPHN|nr:ABC transporter permease [Sphingomonas laterariae]SNS79371.1 ABC-2 type transport system permease protein [Sphingomonas laterariae]
MIDPVVRGRLWAIIVKEIWAVLRDPRSRIILIVPPFLQLIVFGFATTLEVKNIDIALYDRDGGVWAREFSQRLAGSPNVRRIIPVRSPAELRDAIDNRQVIAAIGIDQRFSADIAAGRPATVQAILDGRRSNAAQIVAGYLGRITVDMGASVRPQLKAPGGSIVTHWYNPNLDYLWFTMPALVVIVSTVTALGVTAQSVARERELGTFDQLMVSPLRVHEILIGKMVPPLLIGLFNATLYTILIPTVFGVPLTGSVPLFYVALLFYMLALIGLGMLISCLSQTQQQAFLGMFLLTVPAILLSGYASPVDNMPNWLQWVAEFNPPKHFLIVSEGTFLKAMPPGDILANTWPLMAIAAATLTAAALLFRSRME